MKKYRQSLLQKNLHQRAQIIQAIRKFFIERDYLEVETPVRIPAPAPEVHIDAEVSGGWFLQTSPELCMKRLLAAGYPRIFQICKCFRRSERGRKHLPELTMLEWYGAGQDYTDMMNQCEQLLAYIIQDLDAGESIRYRGSKLNFKAPWSRISVSEAFDRYGSIPMHEALRSDRFDNVMVEEIEPRLGKNPIFLYDYPASRGALARLKQENNLLAERFELYIGGLELCNAFSELIDPAEQRSRFEDEQKRRKSDGKIVYPLSEKFLQALIDMPAAAGNALGIDRLVMLLTDSACIDEVVSFTPEEL
jgi:lysyl-tRNA synthetase class 2